MDLITAKKIQDLTSQYYLYKNISSMLMNSKKIIIVTDQDGKIELNDDNKYIAEYNTSAICDLASFFSNLSEQYFEILSKIKVEDEDEDEE